MSDDWASIDAIMRQGLDEVYPAAVLFIEQGGSIRFHRAYGWLDPESRTMPVTTNVLFDLASLTKLFTATGFMSLVANERLSCQTPVAEIIPNFRKRFPIRPPIDPHSKQLLPPIPEFAGQWVDAETVTFWHLLTHTSGLAPWDDLCQMGVEDTQKTGTDSQIRRARLDAFLEMPRFVYPPGQGLQYSDLGFILLGEAIERASGLPLPEFLRKAVFRPLGMTRISFNPLTHSVPETAIAPTEFCSWRKRRLWGEVHDENAYCLGGVSGHAGLFATAQDVAALGRCFLRNGDPLLPAHLAGDMIREHVWVGADRRGLGWKLQTPEGSPVGRGLSMSSFGHTGFTGTSLWVDPERELVIVALTNRVYRGRDGQGIARFRVQLHEAITTLVDSHLEEAL